MSAENARQFADSAANCLTIVREFKVWAEETDAAMAKAADDFAEGMRRAAAIACVSPTGTVVETIPPLPPLATPADDRPTLIATPVTTEAQALIMGWVRHIQRRGFSADQSEIDDERQRAWWQAHRQRVNAYLYSYQGRLVGYGALLQRHDGTWVSSCAVLPGHEGRKFGGRILSHLIGSVEHDVYARALISNPAACSLHNDREWEMTGEDEQCRYYRTRPKVRVEHGVSGYDYSAPEQDPPCGWWMGEPSAGAGIFPHSTASKAEATRANDGNTGVKEPLPTPDEAAHNHHEQRREHEAEQHEEVQPMRAIHRRHLSALARDGRGDHSGQDVAHRRHLSDRVARLVARDTARVEHVGLVAVARVAPPLVPPCFRRCADVRQRVAQIADGLGRRFGSMRGRVDCLHLINSKIKHVIWAQHRRHLLPRLYHGGGAL